MSIALVTQETMYHDLAGIALLNTLKCYNFNEVLTFSNKQILAGARNIEIEHFPSVRDYCEFMLRGILEHVKTDYILFVQWDAMAYDKSQWTDEFLKYDYIGAPWPWEAEGFNVGNGGFSLRSRRLLEALQDSKIQMDPNNPKAVNEDQVIGISYKTYLQDNYGIKYPDVPLAQKFSYELGPYAPSFGFHGPWNVVNFADKDTLEYFVYHMDYSNWNVYKWQHYLNALHQKGYQQYFNYAMTQYNKTQLQNEKI